MKINKRPSAGTTRMSNPGSARERVANPRAGAALAPDLRPAGRSPSESSGEGSRPYVTGTVTDVNENETKYSRACLKAFRAPRVGGDCVNAAWRDPRAPSTPCASSDKIQDSLDLFEDLLFRFIAFGGLRRQPPAAGRKQVFKGVADQEIGIKVPGDHRKSSAITIRRRLVVAANGVAHAHEQGL